ncbi:MAG TPA: DnaJ domain-containing protein [Nitrososphaera sp.]|nr:DnaJ domain-containing protein [Nitrososphaera sp.]
MSNYYIRLGISPSATEDEVRQAYHRLAKIFHPDKNNAPDATTKMAEINLAYETLCDGHRRKKYDLENNIDATRGVQKDVQEARNSYTGPIYDVSCPTCGSKARMGDRFCSHCGTSMSHGRCVQCNFVNNSGTFVCSTCGYIFEPKANSYEQKEQQDDDIHDDIHYEETGGSGQEVTGDDLSEIIRCPHCNEINVYSRGSCWHCGLHFEIDEFA